MTPDQRARALRLADEMERGQTLGYSWGVLDAVALLRELAAEPKCNPTLTECPRCGNRADMQDSHCVMRGGTVMGKPFAVENPSARRTDPERVPLTDEKFEEFIEQFRWYDGDVDRYDIQGFARELLRAHGITGDAK